ncbi:MAG: hypothetical protein GXP53_12445 [Deltaproteobacteria bacterium]|nr:hypothetical protein [Deltaproteobacteria bacterium]
MNDSQVNSQKRRCPRLGSIIEFQYCLISGEDDLPCWKILDCWWETFDVESYLKARLPEAVFSPLATARPSNKVASILDIVEQAKKSK